MHITHCAMVLCCVCVCWLYRGAAWLQRTPCIGLPLPTLCTVVLCVCVLYRGAAWLQRTPCRGLPLPTRGPAPREPQRDPQVCGGQGSAHPDETATLWRVHLSVPEQANAALQITVIPFTSTLSACFEISIQTLSTRSTETTLCWHTQCVLLGELVSIQYAFVTVWRLEWFPTAHNVLDNV